MRRRYTLIIVALVGIVAVTLACNAPTPTPQDLPATLTTASPLQEKAPSSTHTPPQPTPTPATPTVTKTPSPTPTTTETPTPTEPVSTGPLHFPVPAGLDHWQTLGNGQQEATIVLHITGGAPPYTIYHDRNFVTSTWQTKPEIVFYAGGCSALVHSITVESADGQSIKHDYWIPVPWCD